MLSIAEISGDNHRTLQHGTSVFHDALKWVLKGEYRFHVRNDSGEDYDLLYKENNHFFLNNNRTAMNFDSAVLPPYFSYDENDSEKLYLGIFDKYNKVVFESVNEYTIVIAKIILKETNKQVFFTDERIKWFIDPSDRLHIGSIKDENTFLCCGKEYVNGGVSEGDESVMSAEILFHNVFLWQWLTDRNLDNIRYASVIVLKTEGIGAVLDHFVRMKDLFSKRNIKTYLKKGSTRFDNDILAKYFNFEELPDDADESNTIYINNFLPLRASYLFYESNHNVGKDMLNARFLEDIDEYYDAVLGNKKTLGVLMRGTDYINLRLTGVRSQASVEDLKPIIDQWIEEDGYEKILLATEDADILDRMRSVYGNTLVTVSQQRHRVSDFQEGEYLSDVERKKSKADYESSVEDTTVNYFYALVMLSKCTSFIASGQCNGWDVVNSFNGERFLRRYKYIGEKR